MSAVAAIDGGEVGVLVGQDGHLFQRRAQSMAVIGIARQSLRTQNPVALVRRRNCHFTAEFIALVRLAFGNALHLRLMQGIQLVRVLRLLRLYSSA